MALKFIISPAKKMNALDEPPYATSVPAFLSDAVHLARTIRELTLDEARAVWKCSDALAQLNYERFRTLAEDIQAAPPALTAAIVAYEGIQYQHLGAPVMSERQLAYLSDHLRIISGLYGVLRPFDGVAPYRLEMQARLAVGGSRNLYEYWDSRACDAIAAERDTAVIVSLASQEYAKAVLPYAQERGIHVVTCSFMEPHKTTGKLVQKSTEVKAARGTFVRWCAERGVDRTEDLRGFGERRYAFDPSLSHEEELVFVRR